MLCLDRSPGLRDSGLDHVFRAVGVISVFFHKKEDNNPLINRIFESKIDLSLKR